MSFSFFNNIMSKFGLAMTNDDLKDIIQEFPNYNVKDKDNFNIIKTYTSSFEEALEEVKENLNNFFLLMIKIKEKNFTNINNKLKFHLDLNFVIIKQLLIFLQCYKCKKKQIKVLEKSKKFLENDFINLREEYGNLKEIDTIFEKFIIYQIDNYIKYTAKVIPSKLSLYYLRYMSTIIKTLSNLIKDFDDSNSSFLYDGRFPDELRKFIYINTKFKFLFTISAKYLIKREDDIFDYSIKSKRWKDIFEISDIYV